MSTPPRILFHVDMDAFFASVEQRDHPELRGKPVIVGGPTSRGVVAAASYEARKFGVHSAMPTRLARRKCPRGVFVRPNIERYREASRQIFDILHALSEKVEKVSIDEAYIDATDRAATFDEAEELARRLKVDVRAASGLTISVGVAPCKFIAKIASDFGKPDGLVVVKPEDVLEFLAPLPVGKIPGVGHVTEGRLKALGVTTIADLARQELSVLQDEFGKFGPRLYDFARGADPRDVVTEHEIKSQGSENTFERDQTRLEPILEALRGHAERVSRRLKKNGLAACAVTLKVKYGDFTSVTRSRTLDVAIDEPLDLYEATSALLPKTDAGRRPVRLVGLYASSLMPRESAPEGDFFGEQFPGENHDN